MADKKPDWERIEADYRAGILSLREIASVNSVSHQAVAKRAKRDGWTRDLAARIQAKAAALVDSKAVAASVDTQKASTEKLIVDANAQAIATVRLAHRSDISKARTVCITLLDELEAVTGQRLTIDTLSELLDQLENPDGSLEVKKVQQKAREALQKAVSLPGRAGTIKALSDSLKTLVTLEREAWGLKVDGEGDSPTQSLPIINIGFANGGPGDPSPEGS